MWQAADAAHRTRIRLAIEALNSALHDAGDDGLIVQLSHAKAEDTPHTTNGDVREKLGLLYFMRDVGHDGAAYPNRKPRERI